MSGTEMKQVSRILKMEDIAHGAGFEPIFLILFLTIPGLI